MGGIGNYIDSERESYCRDIRREQTPKADKMTEEKKILNNTLNKYEDLCVKCKYAFACDEQDEFNCKERDYSRFELDSHYIETLGPGTEKYYYKRKTDKVKFEDLPIEDKFKSLFEDYKRQIQEQILYDVLVRFYFADWTRKCDYDNMTSEEVVKAAMSVCEKIEKDYNYSLDNDIFR